AAVLAWRARVRNVPDVDPTLVGVLAVVDRVDDVSRSADVEVVRAAGIEATEDRRRAWRALSETVIDDLDAGRTGRMIGPTVETLLGTEFHVETSLAVVGRQVMEHFGRGRIAHIEEIAPLIRKSGADGGIFPVGADDALGEPAGRRRKRRPTERFEPPRRDRKSVV